MSKIAWHKGTAPMTIIDSQVHAYEANTPKRPWHSVPNWLGHATGAEMIAAMDKVGVDGAVIESSRAGWSDEPVPYARRIDLALSQLGSQSANRRLD